MDLDQDVLYWNAHAFFNSKLLLALKDVVALRAAAAALQRHWDPFAEAIPMPFHEKWLEQCAEMAGLIIEQGLHEVCWEDVKPIIESNSDSKLMRLMTEKLDWALEVQSCWFHWKQLQATAAMAATARGVAETLEERENELRTLQNDRPRLLLQKKMGSKKKTVEVEFYRADLTDSPFCFGDTCFYLVSKFADLPMGDMLRSRATALGALAQRFDGLNDHILAIDASGRLEDYVSVANAEAKVHRVHVFNDLPNKDVPFGLAVVDLGGSNENLNLAELYKELMCLDKVLVEKDCSSLLTVLTGYGPKTLRCFAELSVDLVLRELCGWLEYLAPHCRPLRKVQVCSFKSETATEIRNYFAGGRTVPEDSIDQLQRRVANDVGFSDWLEGLHLRPAVDGFIEKARQTVADRKDYHCQLASKMRELIGQFVENFLMASFGVRDAYIDSQRDRFRTGVHLMAGQVAHWMNLHRDLIATPREDRAILSEICQRIKGINDRYVNVGAHPEGLTEQKLDELDLAASETFEAIDEMLYRASSWRPSPTPVATLQQLRTPAAAPRPPRPPVSPASPASPASPTSPVSPTSPGARVTVHMRNGEQYTVDGGRSYVVGGVRKPICKFFCSGSCKQMKNCKQGAHPCRFQDSCRSAKCIFDHPEPQTEEAAADLSEEEPDTSDTEPRFAKEVCRFFTRSHCQRGDRCPFVHPCGAGKSCGKQSCRLDHPL